MMDRNALAKSSAKCWTRLGRAMFAESQRLHEQWETLGDGPGRAMSNAAYEAIVEAEICEDRAYRATLVF